MEANGSAIVVASPSAVQEENVGALMRRATDVAGVCGQIVKNTAVTIQGRKFVRCEGWQSIAVAYGCVASARDVEKTDGGIRAIGEIRRMSDGAVIATAEGFCGDDEKTWQGRPEYAKRAMAQTRAISRVCRSAFAFVVTLIDGNLSTTPYEEADFMTEGSTTPPPPAVRGTAGLKAAMRPPPSPPRTDGPPPHTDADFRLEPAQADQPAHIPTTPPSHDRTAAYNFGKSKGVILGDLDEGSLKFYEGCFKRDLADASKAQWHERTRAQLANLQAELRYRGL